MDKRAELIVAIINRVRKRGGSTNKTKLLKLLYLADIAYYRAKGDTLTQFNWTFHLYGPWAPEFDGVIASMEQTGLLTVTRWEYEGGEAQYFDTNRQAELEELIDSLEAQYELNLELDAWADQPLGRLLDHVYFETEAMMDAVRGEKLDFSKIDRTRRVRKYRRTQSGASRQQIEKVRKKAEVIQAWTRVRLVSGSGDSADVESYTPPRYDENYFELMESLDSED